MTGVLRMNERGTESGTRHDGRREAILLVCCPFFGESVCLFDALLCSFRSNRHVDSFVLLGEVDFSECGKNRRGSGSYEYKNLKEREH